MAVEQLLIVNPAFFSKAQGGVLDVAQVKAVLSTLDLDRSYNENIHCHGTASLQLRKACGQLQHTS